MTRHTSRPVNVIASSYNVRRLTRQFLIDWINCQLVTKFREIEELCSGAAYCQLLDILFAGSISLRRVVFRTNIEYDFMQNFKMLQLSLQRMGVRCDIPIHKLIKGRFLANFKFAQWFKLFFDANYVWREYDPVLARYGMPLGIGSVIKLETYRHHYMTSKYRSYRSMNDLEKPQAKQQPEGKVVEQGDNNTVAQVTGAGKDYRTYSVRVLRSLNASRSDVEPQSETMSDFEKRQEALHLAVELVRDESSITEYIDDIEPPPEFYMITPQSSVNDQIHKLLRERCCVGVLPQRSGVPEKHDEDIVITSDPRKILASRTQKRCCSFNPPGSKKIIPNRKYRALSDNIMKVDQSKVDQIQSLKADQFRDGSKIPVPTNVILKLDKSTSPLVDEINTSMPLEKNLNSILVRRSNPPSEPQSPTSTSTGTTISRLNLVGDIQASQPIGYASGYKYRTHKDIVEIVVSNLHTKHQLLQTIDFTDKNNEMLRVKLLGAHLLCDREQPKMVQFEGQKRKPNRLAGGGDRTPPDHDDRLLTLFYEGVQCADVGTQCECQPPPLKNKMFRQKHGIYEVINKPVERPEKTAELVKVVSPPESTLRSQKKIRFNTPTPNTTTPDNRTNFSEPAINNRKFSPIWPKF